MPQPLPYYRLIYNSRASASVAVETLISTSARKNPLKGITGGLVLLDGVFLQYLEGTQEAVEELFACILADPRHVDVKVLERRAIPKRMFVGWSMALLKWTEQTRSIYISFSPGSRLDLYQTDPSTAAPLFRAWAATADWQQYVSA